MEVPQHRFSVLKKSFFGAALVIFALSLADCGKLPLDSPASGTFGSVYQTIKTGNCNICHVAGGGGGGGSPGNLDFTSQTTAYATLTANSVTGGSSSGQCPGVKIVVASSPSTSYLAAVLFSDYSSNNFAGVTGCLPYSIHHSDQNISADEKTSIIAWITNGALNN